jgi:hypothetical protein
VALIKVNSYGSAASLTIRRLSFGEADRSAAVRKSKTILLMDCSTGSGKTTWINAPVNYVYGVDVEDPFRLKLVDKEDGASIHAHSSQHTEEFTALLPRWIPHSVLPDCCSHVGMRGHRKIDGRDKEIVYLVRKFFSHPNGIQVYLYKDEFN